MVDATLVTIHGFWSSPATWDRLDAIWNEDEQLRGLRIHPFRYSSPKKPLQPLSTKRVPDYDDLAQTLAIEYRVGLAEVSNVAIVTHSQGGLILQRFLAWMLDQSRGWELARIRSIVMLACPNGGSEYLRSIRRVLWFGHHPQAGEPVAVQFMAKGLDEKGDREGAEAIMRAAAGGGDTSAILSLARRLDEAGQRQEAEHLLAQAADSGDTVVMEDLATRLDEDGRREEAEAWLRRAAEAGDFFAMQQLADRLDKAGQAEEAETWLVRAAEVNDHFAHYVRLRLYLRLDETGRPNEADSWLRRDIEAGDTSFLWILAGRLEQAGQAEEAEVLRQHARDAGEYMALYPAIAELEQAGGGLDDFEQLLRRPAEAGELFAMKTLARKFDEAGREAEANQWLSELALTGNLGALDVLAGRLELANRHTRRGCPEFRRTSVAAP